jgi:hypothetical protein
MAVAIAVRSAVRPFQPTSPSIQMTTKHANRPTPVRRWRGFDPVVQSWIVFLLVLALGAAVGVLTDSLTGAVVGAAVYLIVVVLALPRLPRLGYRPIGVLGQADVAGAGESGGKVREARQVRMKPDTRDLTDVAGSSGPLFLEPAEFALDGCATSVQLAPPQRLRRDQRVQAVAPSANGRRACTRWSGSAISSPRARSWLRRSATRRARSAAAVLAALTSGVSPRGMIGTAPRSAHLTSTGALS